MNVLGSPYFLQFCVPLIAVGGSIFLKYVTRNDAHKSFRKEDLAVGLDIAITALLIFVTASSKLAAQLAANPQDAAIQAKMSTVPWIISAFVLGIWGVSTVVRKVGWADEDSLQPILGIAIPDVFGVATLLFVVNWVS